VKKFLIFIVSFNAERHIASVFSRIPYDRLPEGTELLLIDDASNDSTFVAAQEASRNCPIKCTLLKNPVNLGMVASRNWATFFQLQWLLKHRPHRPQLHRLQETV